MACENWVNISHRYEIFKVPYLLLDEDTSAIDFERDRSILLAGHALKVGHNELDCSFELGHDRWYEALRRIKFSRHSSTRFKDNPEKGFGYGVRKLEQKLSDHNEIFRLQWNSVITLPRYNAFPPLTLFILGPLGKAHKSNVCFPRKKRSQDITLSRL